MVLGTYSHDANRLPPRGDETQLTQVRWPAWKKLHPTSRRGIGLWIQGDIHCIVAFEGAILLGTIVYTDVFARMMATYVLQSEVHMR
jgi:hypothetical protein